MKTTPESNLMLSLALAITIPMLSFDNIKPLNKLESSKTIVQIKSTSDEKRESAIYVAAVAAQITSMLNSEAVPSVMHVHLVAECTAKTIAPVSAETQLSMLD
jgi:hypothetical protein